MSTKYVCVPPWASSIKDLPPLPSPRSARGGVCLKVGVRLHDPPTSPRSDAATPALPDVARPQQSEPSPTKPVAPGTPSPPRGVPPSVRRPQLSVAGVEWSPPRPEKMESVMTTARVEAAFDNDFEKERFHHAIIAPWNKTPLWRRMGKHETALSRPGTTATAESPNKRGLGDGGGREDSAHASTERRRQQLLLERRDSNPLHTYFARALLFGTPGTRTSAGGEAVPAASHRRHD